MAPVVACEGSDTSGICVVRDLLDPPHAVGLAPKESRISGWFGADPLLLCGVLFVVFVLRGVVGVVDFTVASRGYGRCREWITQR